METNSPGGHGGGGGGGGASSNITQIGGAAIALGQTDSAHSLPVTIANDQTLTIAGSVTAAGSVAITAAPITPVVSGAGESSHVLKASAGTLFSCYAVNLTGTPGYLVVLNATSAPADGAITPLDVAVLPAFGSASIDYSPIQPRTYSTGITAVVTSAATPFTKTTGVITAFINGGVV